MPHLSRSALAVIAIVPVLEAGVALFAGCSSDDAGESPALSPAPEASVDAGSTSPEDADAASDAQRRPFIGVNYTHYHSSLDGNGILATYHQAGVRDLVKNQLAVMHDRGAETTRLLIWHGQDIGTNSWGVIPYQMSAGELAEPYRTNLIDYLSDVKGAGFVRLTVAFGPFGVNDPKENYGATCNGFDAGASSPYLEENWSFIRYVRGIAREHGPADVRFDLLNEGAPYDWLDGNCAGGKSVKAQVEAYDRAIYGRYATEFGTSDVTISVMASNLLTCDVNDAGAVSFEIPILVGELNALVDIVGDRPPGWFAVHSYFPSDKTCQPIVDQSVLAGLMTVDSVLEGRGIAQPLVVQETYYDDPKVAAAIGKFMETSTRPIDEVMEWPLRSDSDASNLDVEPPYSVTSYLGLRR